MSRVETPDYVVERTDGPIEVRAYPALTVATTMVDGGRGSAVSKGFRTLANYIFGANADGKKIEMTAPVMQEATQAAVTNPDGMEGNWTVRFVMPREWSLERLPKPSDTRVKLEHLPAAKFAVIRFSGFWRDTLIHRKLGELQAYIASNKLVSRGVPIFAFYNPPWTLPFFRRNEILIEVQH